MHNSFIGLTIASVERAVHAALCIFDKIFGTRETRCQTCKAVMLAQFIMQDIASMKELHDQKEAYRVHMLSQQPQQRCWLISSECRKMVGKLAPCQDFLVLLAQPKLQLLQKELASVKPWWTQPCFLVLTDFFVICAHKI